MTPTQLQHVLARVASCQSSGLGWSAAVTGPAGADLDPRTRAAFDEAAAQNLPFSAALRSVHAIDAVDAAILEAGERTGHLDASLADLQAAITRRVRQRNALLVALAYPVLLVCIGLVVMPLPLVFTAGTGAYLARVVPGLLAIVGALVFGLVVWPRIPADSAPRRIIGTAAAYTPLVASAVEATARARFAGVLARAFDSGLGVREGLTLAARAVPAGFAVPLPSRLAMAVERQGLSQALDQTALFRPHDLALVAAAERAGKVVETLKGIEQAAIDESAVRARRALVAVGAIAFALVAGAIAYSVVSGFKSVLDEVDQAIEMELR